jgi:choline dehydrogenase
VLAKLGVAVVHALAGVGENLQDHFQVAVQHGVRTTDVLSEDGKFPRVVWSVLKYVFTKGGALAFPAANIGAFVAAPGDARPSLQLHFTPGAGGMDEKGNMVASKRPGVNSISCVLQPTSRGSAHASSADAKAPPTIVHNYLATEEDRRRTLEGFKLQRRIYAASPFAEWATEELQPGAAVQSDDEILAYCRAHGTSVYHPVGTARMGAKDDALAVVDADLRVHGLVGLRVVDASIFPDVISGNTHAPVVAVAERAAERILAG